MADCGCAAMPTNKIDRVPRAKPIPTRTPRKFCLFFTITASLRLWNRLGPPLILSQATLAQNGVPRDYRLRAAICHPVMPSGLHKLLCIRWLVAGGSSRRTDICVVAIAPSIMAHTRRVHAARRFAHCHHCLPGVAAPVRSGQHAYRTSESPGKRSHVSSMPRQPDLDSRSFRPSHTRLLSSRRLLCRAGYRNAL